MIEGYEQSEFTHEGVTRTVYRRGQGPGVIVMHEIPGIHPTVVRFSNWVVDAGFSVVMPELLGHVLNGGVVFVQLDGRITVS